MGRDNFRPSGIAAERKQETGPAVARLRPGSRAGACSVLRIFVLSSRGPNGFFVWEPGKFASYLGLSEIKGNKIEQAAITVFFANSVIEQR